MTVGVTIGGSIGITGSTFFFGSGIFFNGLGDGGGDGGDGGGDGGVGSIISFGGEWGAFSCPSYCKSITLLGFFLEFWVSAVEQQHEVQQVQEQQVQEQQVQQVQVQVAVDVSVEQEELFLLYLLLLYLKYC